MARRAFLHIGTAKSGTTYLQELWWRHRDALAERGLLLPGTALKDHFHAAALVKGMTEVTDGLSPRDLKVWSRMLSETRSWDHDVLISHEHFSDSPAEAARTAVAELADAADEVHLVLTVRDLGRVLPSAWQQRVKQGARQTYDAFLAGVRREHEGRKFWRYQDVAGILERWADGVPDERVHLVVVPGSGAPRDELWQRTARVLGVDVDGLDTTSRRPNESLGVVESELLRRLNVEIPREERSLALQRYSKGSFTRDLLAGSAPRSTFSLPEDHAAWVVARAQVLRDQLVGRYDVTGDLDDLIPRPGTDGRNPHDVGDREVLDAATTVVARMIDAAASTGAGR